MQRFAFTCNRRFHQPIETSHALDCAYSVATWIWSEFSQEFTPRRGAALDHSSVAQAWRGTWGGRASGVSRRRETQARDRAIVRAIERGESMRSVAAEHGIAVGTVHWIVRRGND